MSYSISTSNHNPLTPVWCEYLVVSYSISTSNHNYADRVSVEGIVVSYSISTSNHNIYSEGIRVDELCLIPFLHQTTTCRLAISWYIGCVLFHFYIKPQLDCCPVTLCTVVSYSISTSNHNKRMQDCLMDMLCLIPFLHQTTTTKQFIEQMRGLCLIPFLHQTTTMRWRYLFCGELCLIPFLHQTTTQMLLLSQCLSLCLIPFLHQTTTIRGRRLTEE